MKMIFVLVCFFLNQQFCNAMEDEGEKDLPLCLHGRDQADYDLAKERIIDGEPGHAIIILKTLLSRISDKKKTILENTADLLVEILEGSDDTNVGELLYLIAESNFKHGGIDNNIMAMKLFETVVASFPDEEIVGKSKIRLNDLKEKIARGGFVETSVSLPKCEGIYEAPAKENYPALQRPDSQLKTASPIAPSHVKAINNRNAGNIVQAPAVDLYPTYSKVAPGKIGFTHALPQGEKELREYIDSHMTPIEFSSKEDLVINKTNLTSAALKLADVITRVRDKDDQKQLNKLREARKYLLIAQDNCPVGSKDYPRIVSRLKGAETTIEKLEIKCFYSLNK